MDIIAVDKSAREAAKEAQELVDAMRGNMQEFLLYGVPRTELERVLNRVFQEADPEQLGYLNRNVCILRVVLILILVHTLAADSGFINAGLQTVPANQ